MRDRLLRTAGELRQPDHETVLAFERQWETIAATGTRLLMDRPDREKLLGKGNEIMAEDNNRNFPRFMLSLFSNYRPDVFVDTVLWVFRAYRSHGFHTTYWAANLNIWVDLLKKELPVRAFEQVYPFYHWLIVNIPAFTALTDPAVCAPVSHPSDCGTQNGS